MRRLLQASAAAALTSVLLLAVSCGDSSGNVEGDGDEASGSGGSGSGSGSGSGDGDGDGDGDAQDALHGFFVVTLQAENKETGNSAFSTLQGNLRDGVLSDAIGWELSREEGDCQLFVPAFPFCDPACASGSTCVAGDVCQEDPAAQSVGTLTVTGLETIDGELSFSANPIGDAKNYLLPGAIQLTYPPADEGASISLDAPGGDFAPLNVESFGIGVLTTDATEVPIAVNEPVSLAWDAPGENARSRMEILVEISHHGGRKGKLVCDVEDTGSFSIDASLITELINLGYAGFPTVTLSRKAVGKADPPHEVELIVVEHLALPIVIEGLVSCSDKESCPDGQACQQDKTCG